MFFCIAISGVVLIVTTFLTLYNKKIDWKEWAIQNIISILLLFGIWQLSIHAQTRDKETWSVKLTHAVHYPWWREHYTTLDPVYTTDSKGNSVISHYEINHHYVDHPEHWKAFWASGSGKHFVSGEERITESKFLEIVSNFSGGKLDTVEGHRPNDLDAGDPNDYHANKLTDYDYPMTTLKTWENRVKAAPSVFSFKSLNESEKARTFEWPQNSDPFESDRLLGTARNLIDIREWDLMNSRLGPFKKVNVIMCGFLNESVEVAQLQEARWIGGKKNDLVICFGGATKNKNPDWVYVFSWTDKDLVKVNLQSKLINSKINDNTIPVIEEEIAKNYEIKEWRDFSYLQIEPPKWVYFLQVIVQLTIGVIGYIVSTNNQSYSRFIFNRFS